MSAQGALELRALPPDTRWGVGLWAFVYEGVTYFASYESTGWAVVREGAEDELIVYGHGSKATAKRAAMNRIDEGHSHG